MFVLQMDTEEGVVMEGGERDALLCEEGPDGLHQAGPLPRHLLVQHRSAQSNQKMIRIKNEGR